MIRWYLKNGSSKAITGVPVRPSPLLKLISAASLAPYGGLFSNDSDIPPACSIILDVGYSACHVLPVKNGQIIWEHVKRIDVGGKLLTNHLKHLISFTQWNMADETHVVNEVKEACCYVSMNWKRDVEICKYVPPLSFGYRAYNKGEPEKESNSTGIRPS